MCTYNDDFGVAYMGHSSSSANGRTCMAWKSQKAYPDVQFPEQSRLKAENNCRNPKPTDYRTWCYIQFRPRRKWDYCNLNKCGELLFVPSLYKGNVSFKTLTLSKMPITFINRLNRAGETHTGLHYQCFPPSYPV